MNKVILLSFLCNIIVCQIPDEPHVVWMETEYQLLDGNVDITFVWDMWWGENGDHWQLQQNENIIYEADIESNTPNPQHDEVTVTISVSGQYNFIVKQKWTFLWDL